MQQLAALLAENQPLVYMTTWLTYKADEAAAIEQMFSYLPGVQSLDEVCPPFIFDLTTAQAEWYGLMTNLRIAKVMSLAIGLFRQFHSLLSPSRSPFSLMLKHAEAAC